MSNVRLSGFSLHRWRYTTVKNMKNNWQLYSLILPAFIFIFVFAYMPIYGIQIAFRNYSFRKGMFDSQWVGLEHFARYLASPNFFPLLRNTLGINLYLLAVGFPLPIILSFMMNETRSLGLKKTVQMVTYIPHFISAVAICSMVSLMLNRSNGVINLLIALCGGQPRAFLQEPGSFRTIFALLYVWQETGWNSIIYFAALSAVDPQMVEAARIDGANRLQKIFYVDIPTILPTIIVLLILQIGSLVSVGYEKILLLQNDLNMEASDVISTYVYRLGIRDAQYSYTTAIGFFNAICNVVLLVTFNGIARKASGTSLW